MNSVRQRLIRCRMRLRQKRRRRQSVLTTSRKRPRTTTASPFCSTPASSVNCCCPVSCWWMLHAFSFVTSVLVVFGDNASVSSLESEARLKPVDAAASTSLLIGSPELPFHSSSSLHPSTQSKESPPSFIATPSLGCEMCANYEIKLQQFQESERSLKQQLAAVQHLADRYHTEISGERIYRSEMDAKMRQLSEQFSTELEDNKNLVHELETLLEQRTSENTQKLEDMKVHCDTLKHSRRKAEEKLRQLSDNYQSLLGVHRVASEQMRQEAIAMPDGTDELQLLCIQLREELIEARAANEHLQSSNAAHIALVDQQLVTAGEEHERLEANLLTEVNNLRTELGMAQSHKSGSEAASQRAEHLERRLAEFQTTIADLEARLGVLQTERGELEWEMKEYKRKAANLQQELDNSEAVQKDFVKLSQSLQIELEKIRQGEQEVRWQHEEDAYLCSACKAPFGRGRPKRRCLHCVKIFCEACSSRRVPCGPQGKAVSVCEVCHTLLVRNTAPYFSEIVPNVNDC